MVMKDNGNYENEEPFFTHKCKNSHTSAHFVCFEKRTEKGLLMLRATIPQCCHDDEYEVQVLCCPFCGYKIGDK